MDVDLLDELLAFRIAGMCLPGNDDLEWKLLRNSREPVDVVE
jgi:hypothetical protein